QLEAKAKEQISKVEKIYQILKLQPSVFTEFLKEGSEAITIVRDKLSGGVEKLKNFQNMEEAYRAIHTLKGNARALNLDSIGEVCHKLEDELDRVRNYPESVGEKLYYLVQDGIEQVQLELQDGNSLFDKVLGMKTALQDKSSSPLLALESLLRNSIKKESEVQGKKVDFSFKQELDQGLTEPEFKILKNPLLQIIRNSVAHGLESSQEREQLGKLSRGSINIALERNDGQLIVSCYDDGRGLDSDKLKRKAIEKGLITLEEAKFLSIEECYNLIFRSGFSTAEKISGTSGRGVGMDIVKTEIEQAGGCIRIETKEGSFTRFVIELQNPTHR
ncbi:MAG: ATP-binding protein, partial [Spirochaetota bacterium]